MMNILRRTFCLLLLVSLATPLQAESIGEYRRVVFLGDSITFAGQYVDYVEAYLRLTQPSFKAEIIDLGLPSETVSGLSEPGHAGGKFPRPDLHERLDRVLAKAKPDLVVACYGMNCGIYHPLSDERFAAYRQGMEKLRAKAEAAGAKVLHVTPPVFDPLPIKARTLPAGLSEYKQPFEGYNGVLDHYSAWLLSQRAQGWQVVDAHSPTNAYLAEQRKTDAKFTLAGDGVHCGPVGHWLIARALLLHCGVDAKSVAANDPQAVFATFAKGSDVLKLVSQRRQLLRDAWLSETGHLRPGVKAGLPLTEAQVKADELNQQLRMALQP